MKSYCTILRETKERGENVFLFLGWVAATAAEAAWVAASLALRLPAAASAAAAAAANEELLPARQRRS